MSAFVLSPAAAADVEGIVSFLDDHAPHATPAVLDTVRASMSRLGANPGLGHVREDLADEPLRFYAVWSYLVIYRVTTRVEIVRVLHAARDVVSELSVSR